jgi:hypothetical protein
MDNLEEELIEKLVLQGEQIKRSKKNLEDIDDNIKTSNLLSLKMRYSWWNPMYWWKLLMIKIS